MKLVIKLTCALAVVIFAVFIYCSYADNLPRSFPFSRKNALEEWQEKIFKGRVFYSIESTREGGYLSAKSKSACSGLFHRVSFDPKKLPMISWQWKVLEFPKRAGAEAAGGDKKNGWVERDDYAARVYVVFPSFNFKKTKSIEYIWGEDIAEETVMTSPYFKNIKLIAVESGRKNIGKWVFEERNIYEDYKKVFGKAPSSNVGAVALMTDTDNTVSTAEALYRNIKVGYKNE